jgi:ferredoxin
VRLRVNPIACTGHGMCAELLPELITLDPWGYPLLASEMVPRGLAGHARRAAAACPTLALLTDDSLVPGPAARGGRRHAG